MSLARYLVPCLAVLLGLSAAPAVAQCTIDFEDLAVGTAVTSQYAGVTFSVQPQTCGGLPTLYMRIVLPPEGTSSGVKATKIDTGCPDFSDDYLRMVFAQAHQEISFTLGDWAATYTVRYYSTTSGGSGLIGSFPVDIPGTGDIGVHRRVTVTSASSNIRRIEVQGATSSFEALDDLTFYSDATPPIAEFSQPTYEACDCDNSISVRGRACEDDGVYDHDTLHYMLVGGNTWTLVDDATTPQCTPNGALYTWNTTGVPDGCYFLRMTVYNQCGLTSEAVTVVCLDRTFDTPVVRTPTAGQVVGGVVCLDGTVYDPNSGCFDHYTAEWKPAVGGAYAAVDPANPQYAAQVLNDPLASWNTQAAPFPADGNYLIRVRATNTCAATSETIRSVTVDNTVPVANITQPVPCDFLTGIVQVRGTASDAHFGSWVLQYSGGNAHGWVTIANGNAPVINNVLGNWDTSALRWCAYTLRLLAYDTAVVSCDDPHMSEYTISVNVGERCDINGDGTANPFDIDPFINCLTGK